MRSRSEGVGVLQICNTVARSLCMAVVRSCVCVRVHIYVYMYVYVCVYIYIHAYICMYIFICMYSAASWKEARRQPAGNGNVLPRRRGREQRARAVAGGWRRVDGVESDRSAGGSQFADVRSYTSRFESRRRRRRRRLLPARPPLASHSNVWNVRFRAEGLPGEGGKQTQA